MLLENGMSDVLKLNNKIVVIDIKKNDDIDWDFENREEYRLDAMYDARYANEPTGADDD